MNSILDSLENIGVHVKLLLAVLELQTVPSMITDLSDRNNDHFNS